MFRTIANKIKGRNKSIDENLTLEETLKLLNNLNGDTKGNLDYYEVVPQIALKNVAPKDMVNFIAKNFSPQFGDYYNHITHQVYSGEKDKKHYLELLHGEITGRFGEIVVEGTPHRSLSIDFVVEKEK